MAQLALITMNPPTEDGFDALEPIRVPRSSQKAWERRGWTLAEEAEETPQATADQGVQDSSAQVAPAPSAATQRGTKSVAPAPEATTTSP